VTTVKELLGDVAEQEINEQRIMFVRDTAARILTGRMHLNQWHNSDFRNIWEAAQRLWDNKPDDC
jgi:hypothetical protein